jgi:hypothetical protein
MLTQLGYEVSIAIDRVIEQYDLAGTMVRFEHYPRMDDLVEVEGAPEQIERAIAVLGLARDGFTADRLPGLRTSLRGANRRACRHLGRGPRGRRVVRRLQCLTVHSRSSPVRFDPWARHATRRRKRHTTRSSLR